MKKILIVIFSVLVIGVSYYCYSTIPLNNVWNHCKACMTGEIEPLPDDMTGFLYHHLLLYPETAHVELETKRYLIFRFGNNARWCCYYKQNFVDANGNLIGSYDDSIVFHFEKQGKEWIVSDIDVFR